MKKSICTLLWILFLLVTAGPVLADHHAVKVAAKDGVGRYLTDAKGMTLYWFKKDSIGKSVCTDGCLEKWPAYFREKIQAPMGVDAKDFGVITRSDGKRQSTFRGYPLYYFFKDGAQGDTFGHGVKNVWFVVDPEKFPTD